MALHKAEALKRTAQLPLEGAGMSLAQQLLLVGVSANTHESSVSDAIDCRILVPMKSAANTFPDVQGGLGGQKLHLENLEGVCHHSCNKGRARGCDQSLFDRQRIVHAQVRARCSSTAEKEDACNKALWLEVNCKSSHRSGAVRRELEDRNTSLGQMTLQYKDFDPVTIASQSVAGSKADPAAQQPAACTLTVTWGFRQAMPRRTLRLHTTLSHF